MVNSATADAFRPGVLTTRIFRLRAASMSMFTGPPRETAISFNRGSRSITPAENGARWVTAISAPSICATTSSAVP